MSKIVKGKISDLKQDAKNFNKHSEFGMRLLEKSMRKFGFVEAGVISEDGVIVGGNARNEVAEDIGISDKQIIDIDGTKQVYLRKKGLLSNSDEFKEMALALNAVPKANIVFDADILEAEVSEAVCEEWGVDKEANIDYSEKNKEIDIDGMDGSMVIKLNYSEDEYNIVKGQLLKIAATPEDAVWKLLGND